MPHLIIVMQAANRQLVPIVFALLQHACLAVLGRARAADTHDGRPNRVVVRRHAPIAVVYNVHVLANVDKNHGLGESLNRTASEEALDGGDALKHVPGVDTGLQLHHAGKLAARHALVDRQLSLLCLDHFPFHLLDLG